MAKVFAIYQNKLKRQGLTGLGTKLARGNINEIAVKKKDFALVDAP